MDKNTFEEEKKYLETVKEQINREIEKIDENIIEIPKKYHHRYSDAAGGDEDLIEHLIRMNLERKNKLIKMTDNCYFGKIVYEEDSRVKDYLNGSFYIGKAAVTDRDKDLLVLDWRSPVCTLFYEQDLGKVSYQTQDGTHNGTLKKKSQIVIKNGELINIIDTELLTKDELILPFLKVSATDKMKDIVASIQEEQNFIIRYPINKNIIVQGVAGSGKTSVALHRLAYLLYANKNTKPENFLVIGPNECFNNYVSNVLPDLDSDGIRQLTFSDLLKYIYNDKTKIVKDNESKNICSYKTSLCYKDDLERYLEILLEKFDRNIQIDDKVILSSDKIKTFIKSTSGYYRKRIDTVINKSVNYIKSNAEMIESSIWKELQDKSSKAKTQDEKNKIHETKVKIRESLKSGCKDLVKKAFAHLDMKPFSLYLQFLNDFDWCCTGLSNEERQELVEGTKKNVSKKVLTESDMPALLYLSVQTSKKHANQDFKHIVVDEAQDFGLFHFYLLTSIYQDATFSIFGDLAQSIYAYKSIQNWHELNEKIFDNKANVLTLTQSYRTTKEITVEANKVLNSLGLTPAIPVLRQGIQVKYINRDFIKELMELMNKDYSSIAIICKDEESSNKTYKKLAKKINGIKLVKEKDNIYTGGVCVIDVASSKGLEFDAVMIADATKDNDTLSIEDKKRMYVAMTRALHELKIYYEETLTEMTDENGNDKVYKIK